MADVVKSLTIKTAAQGAADAASALNRVADATNRAAGASDRLAGSGGAVDVALAKSTRLMLSLERAAAAQASRLDVVARAEQRHAREVEAANRFLAAGVISQDDYARRVQLSAEAHKAMTAGLDGSSAGLNRMQQMMSMHVMKALVDETVATGQPLRALALEGGRIAEIFAAGEGGVVGGLNAAKVSLGALIGPMTATKAALFGIGGAGLVLSAGLAVAVGMFESLTEKMEEVVKIGAQAQAAGVGTTFFQGWTKQAHELNLETSDLVGMLARAREAATESLGAAGNGEIGNAQSSSAGRSRIQQNVLAGNLSQGDLSRYAGAQDQEARIRVVLDLVEQLRQKGANLAAFDLAKTFFGDEFEQKLRDGVDMIGRMREALDGMQAAGGERVLSQAEIQRAQQMKAELDANQ